ncbi:MAG: rhomboid family intramembrane serine protease [Limisphaerales bacterium]
MIAILWLYWWSAGRMEQAGVMNNKAVAEGEWWRLFTAVTMHGDLGHLAANATTGLILLGLAMARYGAGIALLAAYLAGAGGNLAGYLLYDHTHRGLGASGMVMGALGLVAIQPFAFRTGKFIAGQIIFRSLFAGFLMLVLMGTTPGTDIIAHVGGFVFGAIFGALLNISPRTEASPIVDRVCLVAVPITVILTWALALY